MTISAIKRRRAAFAGALLALVAHGAGSLAAAATNDVFRLADGQTLTREQWIRCDAAMIDGVVRGDLFIMAGLGGGSGATNLGAVTLGGRFDGDVWALGEHVQVNGTLNDDARLAGASIAVAGKVAGGLRALGNAVHLQRDCEIEGAVDILADDVIIEGVIRGPVRIEGSRITLGGELLDEVHVRAHREIVVLSGAVLASNLHYSAPKPLVLGGDIDHRGELIAEPRPSGRAVRLPFTGHLRAQLVLYASALVASLLFVFIFPTVAAASVHRACTAPLRCFAVGACAFLLTPLASLFGAVSLVALPTAALVTSFFLILLYVSKSVVALAIGGQLLRRRSRERRAHIIFPLASGMFIVYVAVNPPVIGILAWSALTFTGLGSLILSIFSRRTLVLPGGREKPPGDNGPPQVVADNSSIP